MAIARKASVPGLKKTRVPALAERGEHGRRDHRGQIMKMISLRLPAKLDARVDADLKKREGRISRNTYILEAIDEKLKREEEA